MENKTQQEDITQEELKLIEKVKKSLTKEQIDFILNDYLFEESIEDLKERLKK